MVGKGWLNCTASVTRCPKTLSRLAQDVEGSVRVAEQERRNGRGTVDGERERQEAPLGEVG